MEDLRVIENELVPVYETSSGEKVVYGTELHSVLQSATRYNDWIQRKLEECDAVEGEAYQTFTQKRVKPNGGRPKVEYIIKLDTAKEMAMLERNDKGKQVRRYFIQVEKKYKKIKEVALSATAPNAQIEEVLRNVNLLVSIFTKGRNLEEKGENPFCTQTEDISDKVRELNSLVTCVANAYGIERNKTLHFLYQTLESHLKISLDAALVEYRARRGKHGSNILHVIAANENWYEAAIKMIQDSLERKRIFG